MKLENYCCVKSCFAMHLLAVILKLDADPLVA